VRFDKKNSYLIYLFISIYLFICFSLFVYVFNFICLYKKYFYLISFFSQLDNELIIFLINEIIYLFI